MTPDIHFLDEVWSADNHKLGVAHHIQHRLNGADPEVGLHAAYVEIQDYNLGMSYYIPSLYVNDRDPETGRIIVPFPLRKILTNTWARRPEFVAAGLGRTEELPRA